MKPFLFQQAVRAAAAAAILLLAAGPGSAGTVDAYGHQHEGTAGLRRTVASVVLPDVTLVDQTGRTVSLPREADDGRPVVLSFIYTTCTAVCPLTTATLAQLQAELGTQRDRVHIMSISIDPEQDTPKRLAEYARVHGAGPEWQHYTGTAQASLTVQRAFDVYRGDKMTHTPVTFIRRTPGQPWVRLDGFATADELRRELPQLGLASN